MPAKKAKKKKKEKTTQTMARVTWYAHKWLRIRPDVEKKKGGGRGMIEMGMAKEREWTRASRTCLCFLGFWDGERLDEHFDLFRFDDQVVDEFSLVC